MIEHGSPEELLGLALTEAGADRRGDVPSDPARWDVHPLLGPARRRWSPERCRSGVREVLGGGGVVERGGRLLAAAASEDALGDIAAPPPPGEEALRALELIRGDGASPRSPGDLADDMGCERAEALDRLETLVAAGRAVRVKPGIYYEATVLERLRRTLLQAAADGAGEITLAEVKRLLGTSRKYAQALLEHLDSSHLTVRQGDRHLLRRAARAEVGSAGATGA